MPHDRRDQDVFRSFQMGGNHHFGRNIDFYVPRVVAMIKELLVGLILMVLIYYFMLEILNLIHPSLARTLKSVLKLAFEITIVWPIKLLYRGLRNFIHPPFDQIHREPPPNIKNPGHRGDGN